MRRPRHQPPDKKSGPAPGGRPRLLTLYVRRECHLCEEMRGALRAWESRLEFALRVVDVDEDPALAVRFGFKVPVLAEGDFEICHHFLDDDAVRAYLEPPRPIAR